jgi:hypothetical protein
MGHKGTDGKPAQFLRRGQRNPGIELHYIENQDENGKVGPVGYKRLEIDDAQVIDVNPEESKTERKHNPYKV